jgi:putative PEP-CTERM system histidine kinase
VFELPFGSPSVISYGVATLAFVAFAVHLALGWRGGLKASVLLAIAAASAAWAGLSAAFTVTDSPALWSAQGLLDALRVGGWLLFLALLLGARKWAAALLLLPLAAWLAHFAPGGAQPRLAYGLLLSIAVTGLVLTEQVFRRAREQARWPIKPLCLGLGGGFAFDLYLYADALLFGRVDADLWAARGLAHALVIPFIAVATARNRDWTIDIALSRGVIFHSTAFLASGLYLLAVAAAGYYVRYFGGSWGKTLQAGFIFAALLLLGWLFSSGTLRSKLRVFINKNFFSYRYDYREEWLRFTQLVSTRDPTVSTGQRSIEALANLVESPAGALWLQEPDGRYVQAARWNLPATPASEDAGQPLPRFLARTGWVINVDEYREHPSRYPELLLPEWLSSLRAAWLVVPIIAQDELTGFVVLATPRAAIHLDWEVRDLLKTAARQVGSFLAQIQASQALLEAHKFDAFNKMSAFVVHDLKNLVAQLSLLLKNAERHRSNPRFQDDMLSTVRHVSERMHKLLLQLGTGSHGEENLLAINVTRLVRRVVEDKRAAPGTIELDAPDELVALAHEQRLERTLGHLVQNAIDATRDGGAVRVRVFENADSLVVEVVDTGCGMSEAFVRERLFRPFETTKASGMGIGAYETAQYVRQIGGRIEAQSKPREGTRIRVMLPRHAERASRDEQAREVA